jgi:hypothetical protein
MTGRLICRVGTFSDGKQSAVFSCRPLFSGLSVQIVFWYPRVEDTVEGEDYR